ncbi:MAG: chemotaxis response regulator protein-glutamate methylesterase [Hyphomonadaceae bacterium JAD_PAG50586_4]|nr:MAG: chemotaxis response regulator protein-glutamate methylesterase [Hyphomonadaceae bacterium JAD_PAG50586_4]
MNRIRVLIVDDSVTIRKVLRATLSRHDDIEVVGEAGDAFEAREAIKTLNPDVLTLDVEMPKMNGIEFLEKIMRLRPMPVIMVSTLTQAGAATSIEALELGAFDCVGKPDFDGVVEKVRIAAHAKVRPLRERSAEPLAHASYHCGDKVLAIGSSTGGVEALVTMLERFPANCPPTLITQHMPPTFTATFAARLDRLCAPHVAEASEGAPVKPGHIYVAPGGERHLELQGAGWHLRCRLVEAAAVNGHRPSVDVLFGSVARIAGARGVGVILTGMGRDGAQGLLQMRQAGAHTLGQDQASSTVYGMPKAAFELGAVERQLALSRLAVAALDLCSSEIRGAA